MIRERGVSGGRAESVMDLWRLRKTLMVPGARFAFDSSEELWDGFSDGEWRDRLIVVGRLGYGIEDS